MVSFQVHPPVLPPTTDPMEHVRILPAPPAAPNNGPLRATTLMCVATLTVVAVLVRWGVTPSGHWIANQAPTAAARPLTHAATRPVQSAPGVRSAPHRSRYATGPRQGPQSSALPPLRAAGGPEVAAAAYGLVPGLFGVLLLGVAAAAALLHKSQCRPRALAVTAQSTATPDSPDGEKHSPFESDPELPAHAEGSSSELTRANVERVLDEVRPYLIADGGNVELVDIVDKTVRLQLQGACGSCPASTTTMSMGIKRRLKEEIPSIEVTSTRGRA